MRKRDDNQVFVKELHPNIVRNLKSNFVTLKGMKIYIVGDTLYLKATPRAWEEYPVSVLMQGFDN